MLNEKNQIQHSSFSILKRSANRKAETVAFAAQENRRGFFGLSEFSVRVEIINQAKRHVDDRHLYAQFHSETGAEIAEFIENRLVNQ